MKSKIKQVSFCACFICLWIFNVGGCTTTTIAPAPAPTPPAYTFVPHPQGMNTEDLSALFTDEKAPKDPEFVSGCDAEYRKLQGLTQSVEELAEGALELVKKDPVSYHWCFYGKILDLEKVLKSDAFLDEKQKKILNIFDFLTPIAKSFSIAFHDNRYLLMAVRKYQKMSEWIFFRKVELTPAGTAELVQPTNPFGLWRDSGGSFSVLEKYHLIKRDPSSEDRPSTPSPEVAVPSSAPAPDSIPSPTPTESPAVMASPVPTPELKSSGSN